MTHLIIVLLIGAVAGGLAGLLLRGRSLGLLFSIVLGIAGGWVCNHFFGSFFSFVPDGLVREIVGATAGAIILTIIINIIFGAGRGRDSNGWRA